MMKLAKKYEGRTEFRGCFVFMIVLLNFVCLSPAETVVEWDFTRGTHGWTGNRKVKGLRSTSEGLVVNSNGEDPWIEGPKVDFGGDKMVRVTIKMKSTADSGAQLFYGPTFTEDNSRRATIFTDGKWHEYTLMLPTKPGRGTRFRLDPCGFAGSVTVAFIRAETLTEIKPPRFKKPIVPKVSNIPQDHVVSGNIRLKHSGEKWGEFAIEVNGEKTACGYTGSVFGYMHSGQVRWTGVNSGASKINSKSGHDRIELQVSVIDERNAKWLFKRTITKGAVAGTISIKTQITVDRDTDVVSLPWFTMFAGMDSFGERKHQGLLAGMEYLSDEPSSSTADITTAEHIRRVPNSIKITFPLMAVEHGGRYIGMIWEKSEMVAPGYDSPDTVFKSGGHAMWLTAPAVGDKRFENRLCAHSPFILKANKAVETTALIIGGKSDSIIGAVKHYVDIKGFPELPVFEGGFQRAIEVLAHGWLDSAANRDWLFRHAVWGSSFNPSRAADAAMYMTLLAEQTDDSALAKRLKDGSKKTLARLSPNDPFSSAVSHVRPPAPPLVFGRVEEYVRKRKRSALAQLNSFDVEGKIKYRPGKADYGKGHFQDHANGIDGRTIASILETATLCMDAELIQKALAVLDKQTKLYANTVPRGAQTWEVPLHTPDILASAHMVKAYTLGFVLSGDKKYLEQARYWAWTGVPFIYLENPTDNPVGPYATIAVLGATNWRAPVWFGKPVQWCGLVYGSSLYMLSDYDPDGPWLKIAKGITISGLQMTWPESDTERQGLLPDFFHLVAQVSDGPAINPGTVGNDMPRAYEMGRTYDFKKVSNDIILHAPCEITNFRKTSAGLDFSAAGISAKPYYMLISGVKRLPKRIVIRSAQGKRTLTSPFESDAVQFTADLKIMTVRLQGKTQIQMIY